MKKLVQPEVRCECSKCDDKHIVKAAKYEEFCDVCSKQLDWNSTSGYPLTLDHVGISCELGCSDHTDYNFCSIRCALTWMRKYGTKTLREHKNTFFSTMLHLKDLEDLEAILGNEL